MILLASAKQLWFLSISVCFNKFQSQWKGLSFVVFVSFLCVYVCVCVCLFVCLFVFFFCDFVCTSLLSKSGWNC